MALPATYLGNENGDEKVIDQHNSYLDKLKQIYLNDLEELSSNEVRSKRRHGCFPFKVSHDELKGR